MRLLNILIRVVPVLLVMVSCSWRKIDVCITDPNLRFNFSVFSTEYAYLLTKSEDNRNYIVKSNDEYPKIIPMNSDTGLYFERRIQQLLDTGEYLKEIEFHPDPFENNFIMSIEPKMLFSITPNVKSYTWYVRAPEVQEKTGPIFQDLKGMFDEMFKNERKRKKDQNKNVDYTLMI